MKNSAILYDKSEGFIGLIERFTKLARERKVSKDDLLSETMDDFLTIMILRPDC